MQQLFVRVHRVFAFFCTSQAFATTSKNFANEITACIIEVEQFCRECS